MAQAVNYKVIDSKNADATYIEYRKFVFGVVKANPRFLNVLSDEDIITDLITEAAMSDWRWDSTKGMKKESFRYQNILFFLRKNSIRAGKRKMYYMDEMEHFSCNRSPVSELIEAEMHKEVKSLIEKSGLTDKEKDYVNMYYVQGLPAKDIAAKHDVSDKNVYLKLNNSIEKMKKCSKT